MRRARHLTPCAWRGAYQSTLGHAAGQSAAPGARSLTLGANEAFLHIFLFQVITWGVVAPASTEGRREEPHDVQKNVYGPMSQRGTVVYLAVAAQPHLA